MRRRAEPGVGPVDFPAGCAGADQAELADTLRSADTFEREGDAGIEARRRSLEVGRKVEALCRHAGARHRLRGAAHAPPHAAQLAGKAMVVLAALRCPAANTIFRPPHLDYSRQPGVVGGTPIEAVAAEIDESPAAPLEGGEGIEHALRGILGMGTSHDAAVGS